MKELSFEKMESIEGGNWMNWIDAGCAVWGAVTLYTGQAVNCSPVGAALTVGCIGWGLGRAIEAL